VSRVRKLLFNSDTLKTEILMTPIKDLGLRIGRSILEPCIDKAREDMTSFGVELEPHFYLSDTYGCIEGTTNIALGFWDADRTIREILRETKDIFRDEGDILRLLRHEIGHAFCYAFKLYQVKEFREVFKVEGNFFQTYPKDDRYRWNPWSTDFVNPEGDFYAQKHPDDDFAETFAVAVDPDENWRERYRGRKGVLRKIQFVRRLIRTYGRKKPLTNHNGKGLHLPVEEMKQTTADFFRISPRMYILNAEGYLDPELRTIFRSPGRIKKPTQPSWALVNRYRVFIEKTVVSQSRIKDPAVVREIIAKMASRLKTMGLVCLEDEEDRALAMLTGLVLLKAVSFRLFGRFKLPSR